MPLCYQFKMVTVEKCLLYHFVTIAKREDGRTCMEEGEGSAECGPKADVAEMLCGPRESPLSLQP